MASPSLTHHQQLQQLGRLIAAGEFPAAFDLATQLHKAAPRDPSTLIHLAHAQRGLGRFREALVALEKADALLPGHPSIVNPRGMLMMKVGRFADALKLYERALRDHPKDAGLASAAAQVISMTGDHRRALNLIKPFVDAAPADSGNTTAGALPATLALTYAKIVRQIRPSAGLESDAVAHLERLLQDAALAPVHRTAALFELGALHDRLDNVDAAFDAYARANASRRVAFDPAENARRIDAVIQAWTRESLASAPVSGVRADRALFIVGMPRSATSLVEQILASHPQIAGGDELPDLSRLVHTLNPTPSHLIPMLTTMPTLAKPQLERHTRAYLDTLRAISATAKFVTDKTPPNFLHLGLVQQMLPGARIIHCTRDPRDTCVSCYFQNFGGNNAFAYDLAHLARFYRDYVRLMEHWRRVLNIPMLDVSYEELVRDQSGVSRHIIEFLGLPWDDRCLRFHENTRILQTASNDQVRQTMFGSSVGRWRRYQSHLAPLIAALGDAAPPLAAGQASL